MKSLLSLIVVLLIIAGSISGIGYIYASKNIEQIALGLNIKELSELENTAKINASLLSTGNTKLSIPLFLGSEAISEEVESTSEIAIDIEKDSVVIKEGADSATMTVDEFIDKESPIKDYPTWEKMIKDEEYDLEETELNGEKVWKYRFQSAELTSQYLPTIEEKIMKSTNDLELQLPGVKTTNVEVNFDGDFIFDLFVGQDDYILKQANVSTTEAIVINMEFTGEAVDQVISGYEQIKNSTPEQFDPATVDEQTKLLIERFISFPNGEIPEPIGSIEFEDLKMEYKFETFELKDGKSIPTNPLMLLLASLM